MVKTLNIKSKISVINKAYPITYLTGRDYSAIDFAKLIESGIDVCCGNGEFYTIVYDVPLFAFPIKLEPKDIHDIGNFLLCDFSGSKLSKKSSRIMVKLIIVNCVMLKYINNKY